MPKRAVGIVERASAVDDRVEQFLTAPGLQQPIAGVDRLSGVHVDRER
ncbi:hypothetical protein [Catellatospora paridis]|nr:hypothetical protein [Catellatospora paridis]